MSSFSPISKPHKPSPGPVQPVADPEHRPTREAEYAKLCATIRRYEGNINDTTLYKGVAVKRMLRDILRRVGDDALNL